ncbi:MAG: hypothetical protein CMB99_16210 [Flavobacteriaceae bacterium]|nr:hypothetical protein [Flavobacteriaceae bacterium]|tara:strand:- start:16074 stop:17117 length:1044 start_codon:yes stop_codon:yes gene_type:complete
MDQNQHHATGGGHIPPVDEQQAPPVISDSTPKKRSGRSGPRGPYGSRSHNPAKPSLDITIKGNRRPPWIQAMLRGIQDYYNDPFKFPMLANLSGKQNLDGSPRQNRSDGRESEVRVAMAIVSFLDAGSFMVGTPLDNGGFKHRDCIEIARVAGMLKDPTEEEIENRISPRPTQTFWRAWHRLEKAGMFESHKRYFKEFGIRNGKLEVQHRARPSIKKVSRHFLVLITKGLDYKRLEKFSKKAYDATKDRREYWAKKHGSPQDKEIAEQAIRHNMATKGLKTHSRKGVEKPLTTKEELTQEFHQTLVKAQADLVRQGKDKKAILNIIADRYGNLEQYLAKNLPQKTPA